MGSSIVYVKVFEFAMPNISWTCESCGLTLRIVSSIGELVKDVLLWTPTYGQAKAGQPARTYIQQLCEETGCNPEDLPEAMNDREKWREMVKDIRAGGTTWWLYIYITTADAGHAYDLTLIINTHAQAECLRHSLEQAARGIGLFMNSNKTELMCSNNDAAIYILNG